VGYIVGISLAYIIGSIIDIPISIELSTVFLAISVSTGIGLIFSVVPVPAPAKYNAGKALFSCFGGIE